MPDAALRVTHPLPVLARRTTAATLAALAVMALLGGAVRALPWLLDRSIPLPVLWPFCRALAALAGEVCVLFAWPIGWVLAARTLHDRGEARALAALGESPLAALATLRAHAAVLTALLVVASWVGSVDASEPGRVLRGLVASARSACVAAAPTAVPVPLASVTWVCPPEGDAIVVGRAPLGSTALFSARSLFVAGDLRRVELQRARAVLGTASVRVERMTVRGLPPLARAAEEPPLARALVLVLAALASAAMGAWMMLRHAALTGTVGRVHALLSGLAGPAASLATLRMIEARFPDEPSALAVASLALVPCAGALAATIAVRAGSFLSRLSGPATS